MLMLLATSAGARQSRSAVRAFPDGFAERKQDTILSTRNLFFLLMRASPTLDPLWQSIMTADPVVLDSLLDLYPHLRRVLLHELMTTPPHSDWLAIVHDSLSRQLYRYSQTSEFDRASLTAKRQNELFGNQLEFRNRFYQTDVIKFLRWINGLVR
jgi:hypothetical protein